MSVAVLCGSDRADSFNAVVSAALTSMLTAGGAVVESVDTGAEILRFRPELVDVPPPVVADIRTMFGAADGVVFVVPEYAGGPPGWVKNLTDWMVGSASLYQRPVVVASAATGGGSHAIGQLARTLTWQGALVVATSSIAAPSTKIHAGSVVDSLTIDDLERVTDRLLRAIRGGIDIATSFATESLDPLGIDLHDRRR